MNKPPRSIMDRDFVYVPAAATDIRKTFARVRREQRKAKEERDKVVVPIAKAKQ
jgi:hypothetical protein